MEAWVDGLESMDGDARLVSIALVAGQRVGLPAAELTEALRRAVVVRAVAGDPKRELVLDEEAVGRLAAELDAPGRRRALRESLESLRGRVAGRPAAAAALDELLADGDLAWRCHAAAILAAELAS